MNKTVGVAIVIGIAVVIGVIGFQFYDTMHHKSSVEEYYEKDGKGISSVVYAENPQRLGGLVINKDKYLLGEKVFYKISNIPMGLKGELHFYTPNGVLYKVLFFDGDEKSSYKDYFRPQLLRVLFLCEKEDIIGEWTVLFAGFPGERINFEVMAETLPGYEQHYIECNDPIEVIIEPSLGG